MNQIELVESILSYRQETDAFKKSLETRSDKLQWKFYDGPPFTSWDPHYWHLMQSTVKDMLPRWMTMRWFKVERKRWRDCHGIPAENFVNKKLWITSKKQVEEEFGLKNYVEECRTMVNDVNDNRKWFIDHLWRWVDMDNAYFTMHNEYMESVIHVFADLYHNNLIYKWFKVLGYSRALGTALSNSEIAEWYMDRQDPAVTVKLTLKRSDEERAFELTQDWFGEVTLWVLRDWDKILMVYDTRSGKWFIPWWKVDLWETLQDSVTRELFEEIWITVTSATLVWKTKTPHHWKLWRLNCLECEWEWEFENKEPEKQWAIAWVSKISSENELWYAIKIEPIDTPKESTVIDDIDLIQYDFADLLMITESKYLDDMQDAPVSLLAWTTTPWTLPSNMFAAVNNDVVYAVIFDKEQKEFYVLAKTLLDNFYKDKHEYIITYLIMWSHFVWLHYHPLFDYYYKSELISSEYYDKVHKVMHADFVTQDSWTGIAHEAPAFGEDDYNLVTTYFPADLAKEWLFNPVDDNGDFTDDVSDFAGMNVINSNKEVIKNLKDKGLLVKHETINHSYPHCPRTKEPLIYRAQESRFLKEKELTQKTVPLADQISFIPEEIKKRFVNWLESAPDRNISRSRFWWAPLPIRECEKEECENREVLWSIAQIQEKSGQQVHDLHRPYIDEIEIKCSCGGIMKRIPDVLDCWFESGSMPYGQDHRMKNASKDNNSFSTTADFIAEGLDQTRGWFRSLHVLWSAYTDNIVYKNVVITWMILAEDGKKMSKSLKNYPDPRLLLEKYGSDAFRLYVLWSPVVRSEPLRFSEKWVEQVLKDFVIPLQNVWNFFKTYAEVDNWKHSSTEVYFMRHAEKDKDVENDESIEHRNVPLSEEWFLQIQSKQFVEKVVRIQPDIIISTNRLRATQTAEWAQKMLKEYLWKDVEVIVKDSLVDWFTQASCWKIYQDLCDEYAWKRILIVGHRWRFLYLWNHLFGTEYEHWDKTWAYGLQETEVIKLPTTAIHNELDQRILSEVYEMIWDLDGSLEKYELEPSTKLMMWFMDKLTNWRLRRSRRRFWAEGLNEDKKAVYRTLREVLQIYLKVAAPFAPFVSEWIRQEMMQFGQKEWSIHLEYRPLMSSKYINNELSEEVKQVRNIIKWAMYLRAKHQIKVKQPLQELKFRF